MKYAKMLKLNEIKYTTRGKKKKNFSELYVVVYFGQK